MDDDKAESPDYGGTGCEVSKSQLISKANFQPKTERNRFLISALRI